MGKFARAVTQGPRKFKMQTRARVLTFDIETKPMRGYFWGPKTRYVTPEKITDHGGMLTWAAKWYGEREVITASEWQDGSYGMAHRLWSLLNEADIVVGYNSDNFDVRRVNSELVRHGLPKPSPFRSVDLIKTVRSQFGFPYNRLDEVARELGLPGKLHHEGFELWLKVMAGDEKARRKMLDYNAQDIRVTEAVYDALRGWIPNHPNLGLWAGHDESGDPIDACCNCGSDRLQLLPEQYARTALTAYALVQCRACKTYMRRNYVKERVALRPAR